MTVFACAAQAESDLRPVTEIRILRDEVFDPDHFGALAPLARVGNTIHVTTREHVVRDLLLFGEGDRVDAELLAESERVLRQSGLFRNVSIAFHPDTTGTVIVRTRDSWSTQFTASFSSTAGNREVTLGGWETNFLGYGDVVSAVFRWSDEANRARFAFTKRRFLGRQSFAGLVYREGDDGVLREAFVSQPYFSTTASWSGAIAGSGFDGKVWLYDRGDETGRYQLHRDILYGHASLYGGDGWRSRLGVSFHLEDRSTRPLLGDAFDLGELRNDHRRQISVGLGALTRRFVRLRELDRSGDLEDHAVGAIGSVVFGMELESLGSTRDRPYLAIGGELSMQHARFTFSSLSLTGYGFWRDGRSEERALIGSFRFFNQRWRGRTQALRVAARWGDRLSPEQVVYVGAIAGMRGFPFRYERGDRIVVANFEERIFPGVTVLGMEVGAALFANGGGAWEAPEPARWKDVVADVGAGLRFRNPRLFPLVLRIDAGRGLGPEGEWRLSISTGEAFLLRRRLDFGAPLPIRFASSLE